MFSKEHLGNTNNSYKHLSLFLLKQTTSVEEIWNHCEPYFSFCSRICRLCVNLALFLIFHAKILPAVVSWILFIPLYVIPSQLWFNVWPHYLTATCVVVQIPLAKSRVTMITVWGCFPIIRIIGLICCKTTGKVNLIKDY